MQSTGRTPAIARRLASMLYECLLLLGVIAAGFLFPQVIFSSFAAQTAPQWLLVAHMLLLIVTYFTWFWCHGGQTLAMKTWKILLVDARTGTPPRTHQAILRFLLCWPSIFFFGAGILWAIFDSDRQFLHDRIGCTRLILQE